MKLTFFSAAYLKTFFLFHTEFHIIRQSKQSKSFSIKLKGTYFFKSIDKYNNINPLIIIHICNKNNI